MEGRKGGTRRLTGTFSPGRIGVPACTHRKSKQHNTICRLLPPVHRRGRLCAQESHLCLIRVVRASHMLNIVSHNLRMMATLDQEGQYGNIRRIHAWNARSFS